MNTLDIQTQVALYKTHKLRIFGQDSHARDHYSQILWFRDH